MTPELWKTIRRWLDIVASIASILTVLTFVLTYWAVAVPFIPTLLKYGWPLIAAYAAFRIIQFGRSLYQRFTRLELDVFGNAVDVDTRLEEQAKAHRDSVDEVVRTFKEELQKMSQQLDTQAHNRSKAFEDILRAEIKEREKLSGHVAELDNRLAAFQKREPTPAELLASSGGMMQRAAEKKPQEVRTLADRLGILNEAATPSKRTT
nr:hypothetical protein [Nitrosomonas nitrosa]